VRALPCLLALSVGVSPGPDVTLARLADAVAAEVARVAAGRPVDLAPPEDRTGSGTLGSDLQSLVRARLEGRVGSATTGRRLAIASVIAQVGARLVWVGRAVEAPEGTPVDVLTASTPWDPGLLPLVPTGTAAVGEAVDVLSHATTPPVEGRVVGLAFASDESLLVLTDGEVSLYRRDGLALRLDARRELPGPLAPVRFPGGLVLCPEGEAACWALTSRAPRSVLFSVEGGQLTARQEAEALPWPGAAAGVRVRAGTNLFEAALPGAAGPFLALESEHGWVVGADARLARAGAVAEAGPSEVRAGPALALVWPGVLAAAAAEPPGERDRILLLREDAPAVALAALPVDGAIRALAARRRGSTAVLAAATEQPAGGFRLALFELAERKP